MPTTAVFIASLLFVFWTNAKADDDPSSPQACAQWSLGTMDEAISKIVLQHNDLTRLELTNLDIVRNPEDKVLLTSVCSEWRAAEGRVRRCQGVTDRIFNDQTRRYNSLILLCDEFDAIETTDEKTPLECLGDLYPGCTDNCGDRKDIRYAWYMLDANTIREYSDEDMQTSLKKVSQYLSCSTTCKHPINAKLAKECDGMDEQVFEFLTNFTKTAVNDGSVAMLKAGVVIPTESRMEYLIEQSKQLPPEDIPRAKTEKPKIAEESKNLIFVEETFSEEASPEEDGYEDEYLEEIPNKEVHEEKLEVEVVDFEPDVSTAKGSRPASKTSNANSVQISSHVWPVLVFGIPVIYRF